MFIFEGLRIGARLVNSLLKVISDPIELTWAERMANLGSSFELIICELTGPRICIINVYISS